MKLTRLLQNLLKWQIMIINIISKTLKQRLNPLHGLNGIVSSFPCYLSGCQNVGGRVILSEERRWIQSDALDNNGGL